MKLNRPLSLDNVKDPDDFRRWTDFSFTNISGMFDNNLSFADNIDGTTVSGTFTSANSDIAFTHNLNRIPVGYIVVGTSAAMSVYDGSQGSDTSVLYLRSNAAGVARVFIF